MPTAPPPSFTASAPPERRPDGHVIALKPFGCGVAYKVSDQLTSRVLETSVAPDAHTALARGQRIVVAKAGKGEPITVIGDIGAFIS